MPAGQPTHTFDDTEPDPVPVGPELRLSFRPEVGLISATRRYAADLLGSVLEDADATSRVVLAIHELLENTLKYSSDGQALLELVVASDDRGRPSVRVLASNRTTPERAAELGRRIEELSGDRDLMELYVSMMQKSVHRAGSGLGLARIRVESEMELSYVQEGDRVTVTASTAS